MISLSSKIPLRLHQIPCSKAYMHGAFVRYKLYHQGNHCHMVHLGMDKHHFSYYSMYYYCVFHLGESNLNFPITVVKINIGWFKNLSELTAVLPRLVTIIF